MNEVPLEVGGSATVAQIAQRVKPSANIYIVNGFPVAGETVVREGDRLVLIVRGEMPTPDELEVLMAARHTPGVHKRLREASVGICGCGGLGSNAAVSLARVGIGTLIIADFDVVEPSNLNRQQYFVDQIGMPKVEALKANLKRINPATVVEAHEIKLDSGNIPELFGRADILIEAFDKADQKAMLVETVEARLHGRPLILGLGMAGYGCNDLLRCRRSGNLFVCGDEVSEAGEGIGLMAPRVAVVANMQANLVLEILLGPDERINYFFERKKSPS